MCDQINGYKNFLIVAALIIKIVSEIKQKNVSHNVQNKSKLILRRYKRKRFWVNPIFKNRSAQGDFLHLYQELLSDDENFFNYTRMNQSQFDMLFSMTRERLSKCSFRQPLCERFRLLLTIRFLATGDSYPTLSYSFRIGKSTVCQIIKETTEVIWTSLKDKYLAFPTNEQWKTIEAEFLQIWNLPNCCGSIDGKHVVIKCPAKSGSLFFNYKKTYSIILLALCDANYNFTYVDIGSYGIESDGGVFAKSVFGDILISGQADFPASKQLPGSSIILPHYIVGDEAFPLKTVLMRPYSGRGLAEKQQIFNKRLSRARRVIENTFGIMCSRFRIYQRVMNVKPDTVNKIVKATCVLHNFIRKTQTANSFERNLISPGQSLNESNALRDNTHGLRLGSRNSTQVALQNRELLAQWIEENPLNTWNATD